MAEFKPTVSQRQAIEARGSAVLVSAGAGSGKTKVLTERLLARLLDKDDPCDIDRFVIITYTRAAAAELRGRIMTAISEALASDPGNRHLRRQNALCRHAQIGTIHSFCGCILRENAHAAGISPDFRIIEDDRADVMRANALSRVLEARYEKADSYPGFTELADTVGAGRDDSRLEKLVLELYTKMQCHARPEAWAERQIKLLSKEYGDVSETEWGQEMLSEVSLELEYRQKEAARLTAAMPDDEAVSAFCTTFLQEMDENCGEVLRSLALGWDKTAEALSRVGWATYAPRKLKGDEFVELLRARRTECKDYIKDLAGKTFAVTSAVHCAGLKRTAASMIALLELTLDFGKAFRADKRRLALMDFSDLEHETVRLLTNEDGSPTELAEQISERYREIMVDEYQDVSQVQDELFRAVSCGGNNLFLVGDIKQSIYRFRLADPEIFNCKYREYADAADAAEGEPRRILLRENFRSRDEIINCANSIFSLCMSRGLGDVDYDSAASLVRGASYDGAVPVPEVIMLETAADGEADEEPPSSIEQEAEYIAGRIRSLIDSGTPVSDGNGGTRPAEYGDIAVLMRAPKARASVYSRVFSRFAIPTAAGGGSGYYSSAEVSSMMSMLAVIDNPHQDIPLIAVLRSPSFAMTGDELSAIRACAKGDFYTALVKAAEDNGRCAAFLAKLGELRAVSAEMPVSELVWHIIEELDLPALCSAMSDGEKRRARIFELVELAEKFEASGYRGLHRFVLWLRAQAGRDTEPAVGISGSSVQIMSMHKSKGLEFPIVFLADTAHKFSNQDFKSSVLVHPELGLGPKVIDKARRAEYSSIAREAIKTRITRENLSEEMRLLYVAVTRARERLFIVGSKKNTQKYLDTLSTRVTVPMEPQALAQAQNMLEWAVTAAIADGGRTMRLITLSPQGAAAPAQSEESHPAAVRDLLPELERRLSFRYPYRGAEEQPSKVTATELKGRSESDEDARSMLLTSAISFRVPDFTRREKPVSGAEKGNATHLVLQYMDFAKAGTLEGIKSEIERLRLARSLSDREAQAVDARAIEKLFASDLGRRMLAADMIRREFKFSLMCDASSVPGCAGDDRVLLQGVVDCCIAERGELVVIDYKTDRVKTEEELSRRAAFYAGQIRAYASAMERIFALPVKECVLYFISAGKSVTVKN